MIEQQRKLIEIQQRVGNMGAADPPGTWLGFVIATALQPFFSGGASVVFYAGLPRASQTPRRFRVAVYVINTNDGANYWTISAQTGNGSVIATVTTGGGVPIAPDTWAVVETTAMGVDPLVAATHSIVQITLVATGTPGDLSLIPMFYVL